MRELILLRQCDGAPSAICGDNNNAQRLHDAPDELTVCGMIVDHQKTNALQDIRATCGFPGIGKASGGRGRSLAGYLQPEPASFTDSAEEADTAAHCFRESPADCEAQTHAAEPA